MMAVRGGSDITAGEKLNRYFANLLFFKTCKFKRRITIIWEILGSGRVSIKARRGDCNHDMH